MNLWDDHFFPEKKFDVFVVAQDKDQKDEEGKKPETKNECFISCLKT